MAQEVGHRQNAKPVGHEARAEREDREASRQLSEQRASWPQERPQVRQRHVEGAYVLEHLPAHDDIERIVQRRW